MFETATHYSSQVELTALPWNGKSSSSSHTPVKRWTHTEGRRNCFRKRRHETVVVVARRFSLTRRRPTASSRFSSLPEHKNTEKRLRNGMERTTGTIQARKIRETGGCRSDSLCYRQVPPEAVLWIASKAAPDDDLGSCISQNLCLGPSMRNFWGANLLQKIG